jgi:hypothetical protein
MRARQEKVLAEIVLDNQSRIDVDTSDEGETSEAPQDLKVGISRSL